MQRHPPLELNNHSEINASVILMHGLGADGYDFEPIVKQLLARHPALQNTRFILPHAPAMAITRHNSYVMPAWYDLYGTTGSAHEDETGIKSSQDYINTLIQTEISRGIPSNRIVLAGFSQGGAIALYTALRYPQPLAAILALSTYLPIKTKLTAEAHPANSNIPIFMAHGSFDDVISLATCQTSLSVLQQQAYPITWQEYSMAHSVCAQEITDIGTFLQQVLPCPH